MHKPTRLRGLRRTAALAIFGTLFATGGCDSDEFTTTSTVTLNTRDVASFLIRSWVLTPIENAIENGLDNLFDVEEDD